MAQLVRACRLFTLMIVALWGSGMSALAQTTTKEAATAAKITPDLYQVMQNKGQGAPIRIEGFQVETDQVIVGNKIAIEAVANNDDGEGLLNQLKAIGLTDGVAYKRIVFGYLPIDRIDELKNVPSLSFARPSYKPITNTGSVTSQGDVSLKANTARTTYSVTGAGVKVGVLSDSYNNLGGASAGVASNDLPAAGVQVLQDLTSGGSDEGRAMAEIVHDVAPGSAIAFNTAFNGQAGFAQGIINLAAAGCKIIVDDVFYFLEPFFQDGPIAQAITQVVNNGATYFSLAGNHARSSYQAAYKSGGTYLGKPTHDFGSGTVDNKQRITIPAGSFIRPVLQWDNPYQSVSGGTGATTDLDFYILSTSGNVIAYSAADQTNGGDPVEYAGVITNTTSSPRELDLVIVKYSGPDPGLVKWMNFGNGAPNPTVEYDTKSSTLVGHSNSANAISVGAAPYSGTPAFNGAATATIEAFSSAGGTPILFTTTGTRINGITGTVYQKPEITSVDGGDNTFFGFDSDSNGKPNFFGTSAAAPHAAAVGALMKEKVPTISKATILSTLESTALDMDDPSTPGFDTGFDYGTGFGFIQADLALKAISNTAPTVANTIPPQSATVNTGFTYTIPANTFTDAETPSSLTLSVSNLPAELHFTAPATISGTFSTTVGSPFTITVTAMDPGGLSASTDLTINVIPATIPSTSFTITAVTMVSCNPITPNQFSISFNPQYSGLTGQSTSFSVVNELLPTTEKGPYTLNLYTDNPVITLKATQTGSPAEASFVYNWLAACQTTETPNTPPSVVTPLSQQTATVGQSFVYVIPAGTFTDSETPLNLQLSANGLPAGLGFSGATISGTPSSTVGSPFSVSVTATDPGGLSVTTLLSLVVVPTSDQVNPTSPFSITSVTTISCTPVGSKINLTFAPQYDGLTGQPIAFEVVNEFPSTTTPAPYSLSLYRDNPIVMLRATQTGSVNSATYSYHWLDGCQNLGQDNTPPRLNSPVGAQTAVVGQAFSLNLANTFTDQETPNQITLSANGLPEGLSLVGTAITGTPSTSGVSTVILTATDPGSQTANTSFQLTVYPASSVFGISGVQTLSCITVSGGQRSVTFQPQYSGVTGQPISFSVVNEKLPTTEPGPYQLNLYTDNPIITLKATQTGSPGEATYVYSWLSSCPSGTRVAASELGTGLQVKVLGNPIERQTLTVAIQGVEGQQVTVELVDLQGYSLHTHRIEQAAAVEPMNLEVSRLPSAFILQVRTARERQVIKLLKP